MIDLAEKLFNMISATLVEKKISIQQVFNQPTMIKYLDSYENNSNVAVLTEQSFLAILREQLGLSLT